MALDALISDLYRHNNERWDEPLITIDLNKVVSECSLFSKLMRIITNSPALYCMHLTDDTLQTDRIHGRWFKFNWWHTAERGDGTHGHADTLSHGSGKYNYNTRAQAAKKKEENLHQIHPYIHTSICSLCWAERVSLYDNDPKRRAGDLISLKVTTLVCSV